VNLLILDKKRQQDRGFARIGSFSFQHIDQRIRGVNRLQAGAENGKHLRDIA